MLKQVIGRKLFMKRETEARLTARNADAVPITSSKLCVQLRNAGTRAMEPLCGEEPPNRPAGASILLTSTTIAIYLA